jgi:hypothetical protein
MIVKLNESALFAMGFDRAAVEALRHFLRQVGSAIGGTTLPDAVAAQEHLQIEAVFNNPKSTQQDVWPDVEQQTLPDHGAAIAELAQQVAQLSRQMASLLDMSAMVSELQKTARNTEIAYSLPPVATAIDWTRPGKIGSSAPNTASFTTLAANAAVALSPANANVVLAPTGTGVVTINPATLGSMDKVAIGATTPSTGAFTTVAASSTIAAGAGITSTSPAQHGLRALGGLVSGGKTYANFLAGPAQAFFEAGQLGYVYDSGTPANSFFHLTPYGVAEGSTFKSDTAGNTTVAGKFGCNTKAAQAAAASGGALAAYGAGANGLDTGANMSALHALVSSIRAALVANGIMS